LEKLAQMADDLGGAVQLVAAAPFWNDGLAIDTVCTTLGLNEVFVHAHAAGTVEGTAGSNWPAHAVSTVHPIELKIMDEEKPRRLHAKLFEVTCKRGRIVLSGSANATNAALVGVHNVEACVVRLQRERRRGWTFVGAEAPVFRKAQDEKNEDDRKKLGVLRAVLEGERITGQVITPVMAGGVSVFQRTSLGLEQLGEADLQAGATFSLKAPRLELQSWKGERLVLQVRDTDGRLAEGFVSVVAFTEIARRAGALAPRLFAVLAGTETPADVAAIMSWFHEDPRRLVGSGPIQIGGGDDEEEVEDDDKARIIPVSELNFHFAAPNPNAGAGAGAISWRRFMDYVFSAFRERRGPFAQTAAGGQSDDEDDNVHNGEPPPGPVDPAIPRSLEVFGRLLNLMLSVKSAPGRALTAFDLTQYVCERLQPEFHIAYTWLERLVEALDTPELPPERRTSIAAAILILLACGEDPDGTRRARTRLLRLGYPLSGNPPSMDTVQGFQSVLLQKRGYAELWNEIRTMRTFKEQTRAYLLALKSGQPSTEYAELRNAAPEEWSILQDALRSTTARDRLLVLDKFSSACPKCHIALPGIDLDNLRTVGVATAKNCCRRVLLYAGG
jgi:hypothetical protein